MCVCVCVCVCLFVYQFLVVNFIFSALSVLCLHPQLRNSFHLHSSHWQGEGKVPSIMDGDAQPLFLYLTDTHTHTLLLDSNSPTQAGQTAESWQ